MYAPVESPFLTELEMALGSKQCFVKGFVASCLVFCNTYSWSPEQPWKELNHSKWQARKDHVEGLQGEAFRLPEGKEVPWELQVLVPSPQPSEVSPLYHVHQRRVSSISPAKIADL